MSEEIRNNNLSTTYSAVNNENDLKKYLKILLKRKWSFLIASIVGLLGWSFFVVLFQDSITYKSTVLLSFQDPRSLSAVGDFPRRRYNVDKASLIKTNTLLGEVVERLNLNFSFITKSVVKETVFDYLYLDRKSIPGEYRLLFEGKRIKLFYSNESKTIDNKILIESNIGDTIKVNNFSFFIKPELIKMKKLNEIEFKILDFQKAVEKLKEKISYKMDRYQTILTLTVSDKNPSVAAKIVNTIADLLVKLNLKMKKYKSNAAIGVLENELKLAKEDLDKANNKLRNFRERYPWIVLNTDVSAKISEISSLENQKNNNLSKIEEIKSLQRKLNNSQDINEKISNAREIIAYLSSEGIPVAGALSIEFDDLFSKRNLLLDEYPMSHPFVKENNNKFNKLFMKLINISNKYIQSLNATISLLNSKIIVVQNNVKRLPSKELELADLIRDRDVKDDLYQKILSRYNSAKIDNEVEVSDVYIVDYGVPSPPKGRFKMLIPKFLLGIFIAMGIGIGVVFVLEFFDNTVQTAEELNHKIDFPVLGSIPIILNEWEIPKDLYKLKNKPDPKLITIDYSPSFESESFRNIRTKILHFDQLERISSFVVSSLYPDEGKSLIAANLAITIAQQKISTILVDGDLRRGVLHSEFGFKKVPGLSDILISKNPINYDYVSTIIQNTMVPYLYIIPSGTFVPNPSELLGGNRMKDLLEFLKERFGMVITDTAPFGSCTDATILSQIFDKVIVVVRAEKTSISNLIKKIDDYPSMRSKVLGMILNGIKYNYKKDHYKYSYYNY